MLFILVLEAYSCEFHTGVHLELFYADNLMLIADTQEDCIANLMAWKAGMEIKGLRVNMKKSKCLVSGVGYDVLKQPSKYPCAVYCSGVGNKSIQCSQCMLWVLNRCSGITKRLVANPNYIFRRCNSETQSIDGRTVTEVDVDGIVLDVGAIFCYLYNMLCSGGWCDSVMTVRYC